MDELSPHVLAVELDSPAFECIDYVALKKRVIANQEQLPDLAIRDGKVYCRTDFKSDIAVGDRSNWKLWVPDSLIPDLITRAHIPPLSAHGGIRKTIDRLRAYFYWPNMASQVRNFISMCDTCKETKAPNITLRPPMGNQIEVNAPWQRLYVDLLGPYPRSKVGNVFLLIVLDQFSKFVLLKPLRKADTSSIVKFIESDVFHTFGVPESILTDNGKQFLSKDFQAFLKKNRVAHITTATHSPQVNASERVNRSILAAIRS